MYTRFAVLTFAKYSVKNILCLPISKVPLIGCNFWKDDSHQEYSMNIAYLQAKFDVPHQQLFVEMPIARFFSMRGCE